MTLFLDQLEPGPEVLQMGIDALVAGMEARHGGTWHVVSLPDALKGEPGATSTDVLRKETKA